ncbi:MAG: tRNA (pseudouridine(54)-N(1))-methyltransferase TrmY [Methanomicrobiales archaeon]|nr:tRNA (pseudouridine(54)-N(1))-methyltransferase TrmY [Methanomicrobiales archaeon]
MRRFAVIGHLARTDSGFTLEDMPGGAGRMDILCRCVQSVLFLSHTIRRDTEVYLILLGPPSPPRTILFSGEKIRYLSPDERSAGSLIRRALSLPPSPYFIESTPGVYIRSAGLDLLLHEHAFAIADEHGEDIRCADPLPLAYLLSDHLDFTPEEGAILDPLPRYSVGPLPLHADHAITLIHNELDRRGAGWP